MTYEQFMAQTPTNDLQRQILKEAQFEDQQIDEMMTDLENLNNEVRRIEEKYHIRLRHFTGHTQK